MKYIFIITSLFLTFNILSDDKIIHKKDKSPVKECCEDKKHHPHKKEHKHKRPHNPR